MSHSLHRYGTVEDLKNDFCMYARCARGVNRDDPGDKLRKILGPNVLSAWHERCHDPR